MSVLTHSEYLGLNGDQGEVEKDFAPIPLKVEVPECKKIEYKLFYPDNARDNYYTGAYCFEHGTIKKTLQIVNGVITTEEITVKNELEKRGFVFMFKRQMED